MAISAVSRSQDRRQHYFGRELGIARTKLTAISRLLSDLLTCCRRENQHKPGVRWTALEDVFWVIRSRRRVYTLNHGNNPLPLKIMLKRVYKIIHSLSPMEASH